MPRKNRSGQNAHFAGATRTPADGARGKYPDRRPSGRGEVRIIGGEWRGRKVRFPPSGSVRPSPDRVRETLFNWLQFEVAGKRCLDLFAGSGVLGLEALSRGAREVVFVELDRESARAIDETLRAFKCDRGRVEPLDAFAYLSGSASQPFDIVFLDPPYAERWLPRACEALERGGWLRPDAWIYLEDMATHGEPALPAGWTLMRSKRAGDVGYHLARRGAPGHQQTKEE